MDTTTTSLTNRKSSEAIADKNDYFFVCLILVVRIIKVIC
jgi:hypothetical protein